MSDHPKINELLKDFEPASKEAWTSHAKKELGDQDPFQSLTWVSPDGLHVKPYYDKNDVDNSTLHGFQLATGSNEFQGARSWDNLPPVLVVDESDANNKALQHLAAGAEGILFDISSIQHVNFNKLLKSIALEYCIISFITKNDHHQTAYDKHLDEVGVDREKISGVFFRSDEPSEIFKSSTSNIKGNGIIVAIENPINEVSSALFLGNQRIKKLLAQNWGIEQALASISFSMAIETDFFISISKLKAMRFLWFQLAQAYGDTAFQPENLYLHVRSDAWTNPDFQPHGNMLKGTSAAMAAILGGADGISIYPEDSDNTVMTRIALNTSHVLREEAHLNKVADPLAGSYLVENMVKELAEKAWTKFQSNC